MIVQKLTEEELALYEILRHPVWCGEFLHNLELLEDADPFEYTTYQKDFLLDLGPQVSWRAGRAVGKCLHEDSRILNTETGEYCAVKELYKRKTTLIPSLQEETFKQVVSEATISDNGVQPCLELTLTKGFRTRVTYEHPLFTNTGWKEARNLKIGDYVAIPNALPYFGSLEIDKLDLIMLAHFIAEGTRHTGTVSTTEPEVIEEITEFCNRHNLSLKRERCTYSISQRAGHKNHWIKLLEKYELRDKHSYEKFIPKELFSLPKDKLATFLSRLFGDDGWVLGEKNPEVGYVTTSEQLARDLHHLLLRFGIIASLGFKKNRKRGAWWISIRGYKNLKSFADEIGFSLIRKQEILGRILVSTKDKHNQADIIPIPTFQEYRTKLPSETWTRPLRYYPTRSKKVVNKDANFNKWEDADIHWVRVKSISAIGNHQTYSVEAWPEHTLVSDDIYSHNTESLIGKITWHAINRFFNDILYTVPNRSQLEPVFLGVQKLFRGSKFLSFWMDRRSVNSQTFMIKFLNLQTLICRIAGNTGTGVNVVGLHIPIILVDETGYYNWGTWVELQPVLNDWEPGHQLVVCGVPDGRRERSVCFQCDEDQAFSQHRTSAYENPRFTKEAEARSIAQFGGKESQDFIRQVLGEHGVPTYAVFDREFMKVEDYYVPTLKLHGSQVKTDSQLPFKVVANLPRPPKYCESIVLGIDLGYTEPTAIVGLYIVNGIWYVLFRLELYQISYDLQEKLFDLIDTKYNPAFIGMDAGAGGQGKSVVHNLYNREEYRDKKYSERLVPVEFGGTVVVGYDDSGHELKERIKPFSVSRLQQLVNGHFIVFSTKDEDLLIELENITYSKSPSGNIIYKTRTLGRDKDGDDHNFSALLTFCMVLFEKYEEVSFRAQKRRLFGSKWLV